MRRFSLVFLAALAACVACAEPVKDINLVQPGYLDKSLFDDKVWYYRQTITEADPTQSTGFFVGLEADMEKIRWEIREDQLLAFRAHEGVPGIDEDETRPGADYRGEPIASFGISSHFDIQRGYNTATGEQNNTISETSSVLPTSRRAWRNLKAATRAGRWKPGRRCTQTIAPPATAQTAKALRGAHPRSTLRTCITARGSKRLAGVALRTITCTVQLPAAGRAHRRHMQITRSACPPGAASSADRCAPTR